MVPSTSASTGSMSRSENSSLTCAYNYVTQSRTFEDAHHLQHKTTAHLGHCVVTGSTFPVKNFLVLERKDHIDYASQLEYVLGIPEGTLGEDATRNTITVRTDVYSGFKRGEWMLIPDLNTINELMIWTLRDAGMPQRLIYSELCSEETYEYTLVKLLDARDSEQMNYLSMISDDLPIRLHVHPCYAVCDAFLKMLDRDYTSKDEDLQECIRTSVNLVKRWLIAVPYERPRPRPRVPSPSLSEESFCGSLEDMDIGSSEGEE
ncbi:hypothetical protein RhiJN_25397 [Ceratobasidium sp. AG-Ba]|nr:hypothetical protein RhiJN_25397 [Ceratobasidium sp. AG-Ba]